MGKGDNLTQIASALTPTDIAWLNDQNQGMGERINQTLTHLGNVLGAAVGHRGTVVLKAQEKTDAKGKIDAGLDLSGGRIAQAADPQEDMDVVNLRTLRRYMLKEEDTRLEESEPVKAKPACSAIAFTNPKEIETDLDVQYGVEVLNEYVYVLGEDGGLGKVKVYRINPDNSFTLVSTLVLSAIMFCMTSQGRFLYLTRGSPGFMIVDVGKPHDPIELVTTAIGMTAFDIFAQGRWVYISGGSGVKIIDVSEGAEPIIRGTAT